MLSVLRALLFSRDYLFYTARDRTRAPIQPAVCTHHPTPPPPPSLPTPDTSHPHRRVDIRRTAPIITNDDNRSRLVRFSWTAHVYHPLIQPTNLPAQAHCRNQDGAEKITARAVERDNSQHHNQISYVVFSETRFSSRKFIKVPSIEICTDSGVQTGADLTSLFGNANDTVNGPLRSFTLFELHYYSGRF